jgi:hypothetical protein
VILHGIDEPALEVIMEADILNNKVETLQDTVPKSFFSWSWRTGYRGKWIKIQIKKIEPQAPDLWVKIKISETDAYQCTVVELYSSENLAQDTNAQELIKVIKLFMAEYVGGTIQGNENYKKLMYSIQELAQIINSKIILNQLEVDCSPEIVFPSDKHEGPNKFTPGSILIESFMRLYFSIVIDGVFIGKIHAYGREPIKPPKSPKLNIYYDDQTICYIKTEPRIYDKPIQYKLSQNFDDKDILNPNPAPKKCQDIVKLFRNGLHELMQYPITRDTLTKQTTLPEHQT